MTIDRLGAPARRSDDRRLHTPAPAVPHLRERQHRTLRVRTGLDPRSGRCRRLPRRPKSMPIETPSAPKPSPTPSWPSPHRSLGSGCFLREIDPKAHRLLNAYASPCTIRTISSARSPAPCIEASRNPAVQAGRSLGGCSRSRSIQSAADPKYVGSARKPVTAPF